MKIVNKILAAVLLTAGIYVNVYAQAAVEVKYNISPQSKLYLEGTSTLHNFTINAKEIEGYLIVNKEGSTTNNGQEKIWEMKVIVPVKKLDTDKSSMNDNMDEALKADKAPDITYELKSTGGGNLFESAGDSTKLETTGILTIAGVSKQIKMTVNGFRSKDGLLHFNGAKTVKMTDFGVTPPTMFFGAIRTGNNITVNFNIVLSSK